MFVESGMMAETALKRYKEEVRSRSFPNVNQHCYEMESEEEKEKFREWSKQM